MLSSIFIADDVEVDSFVGQNASVTVCDDHEALQSVAGLERTSENGSFPAVTTLPSSGRLLKFDNFLSAY